MNDYELGDAVLVDLEKAVGHEQSGRRWSIIPAAPQVGNIVIIIPLTTKYRNWSTVVKIDKGDGNVLEQSFALCHQIRAVSAEKRILERYGSISINALGRIKTVLADMFDWGS
jgi:mRNA interferase MazF